MRTVAVLGAGPAGAFTAERLARSGTRTILIDEKLSWEKPCGGGVTFKAYNRYPFLRDNSVPKKQVTHTVLSSNGSGPTTLALSEPLLVYSRRDLNGLMIDRAQAAGAQVEQARVLDAEHRGARWRIHTKSGIIDADYCVVATGARNPLKHVGTKWNPADTSCALGYFIPSSQDHIDIQFFPELDGYIWVFPRPGHLSAGIGGKGASSQELRQRLERYLLDKGIDYRGAPFFGHMLPALEQTSWRHNRVAGEGWLAVGDSAGLVDPVTGEGIYYAIRSADLAAQVILDPKITAESRAVAYRDLLRQDFVTDLEYGSRLANKFYKQPFLFGTMPARMIEFARRSPRFARVVEDLFAGTQDYLTLKRRLIGSLRTTVPEIILSLLLRRFLPLETRTAS